MNCVRDTDYLWDLLAEADDDLAQVLEYRDLSVPLDIDDAQALVFQLVRASLRLRQVANEFDRLLIAPYRGGAVA